MFPIQVTNFQKYLCAPPLGNSNCDASSSTSPTWEETELPAAVMSSHSHRSQRRLVPMSSVSFIGDDGENVNGAENNSARGTSGHNTNLLPARFFLSFFYGSGGCHLAIRVRCCPLLSWRMKCRNSLHTPTEPFGHMCPYNK